MTPVEPSVLNGYSYNHLSREVNDTISNYKPYSSRGFWAEAGPVVRELVARMAPSTPITAVNRMSTLAGLARWIHDRAGATVTTANILHPHFIERYIASRTASSESGRADLENRLRGWAKFLGSEFEYAPPRRVAELARPYSVTQLHSLQRWAGMQTTARKRRNAAVVFALGLGAGMRSNEIESARMEHLRTISDRPVIHVGDRVIPLLLAQAVLLLSAVGDIKPQEAFLAYEAQSGTRAPLLLTLALKNAPLPERLRSTWIVAHLQAGTPLKELQRAAGLQDRTSLARYLAYVTDTDGAFARMSEVVVGV